MLDDLISVDLYAERWGNILGNFILCLSDANILLLMCLCCFISRTDYLHAHGHEHGHTAHSWPHYNISLI